MQSKDSEEYVEYECAACSHSVNADDKVCPKCGDNLEKEIISEVAPPKKTRGFKRSIVRLFIGCVVVMIVVVGITMLQEWEWVLPGQLASEKIQNKINANLSLLLSGGLLHMFGYCNICSVNSK